MIKNPFNKTPVKSKEIEWLSLDEYVKIGDHKIMYARVRGTSRSDIYEKDIIVADCEAAPETSDIVLIEINGVFAIKNYREVKEFTSPLRLAVRNGKAVKSESKIEFNTVKIIGVVTHIVRSLGGAK